MKTNNLKIGAILTVLLSTVSCSTTGDPTKGGLFIWSEEKAIQRSDALKQKQQSIAHILEGNESKLSQAKGKLYRLNKQIEQHKNTVGTSDATYASLIRERDNLNAEIRSYEDDMQSGGFNQPLGL